MIILSIISTVIIGLMYAASGLAAAAILIAACIAFYFFMETISIPGANYTSCPIYMRKCTPDKCQCWDDEQVKRRADLDRQASKN